MLALVLLTAQCTPGDEGELTLDEVLSRLPDSHKYIDFDRLPALLTSLKVEADPELKSEAISRLRRVQSLPTEAEKLLGLVGNLSGAAANQAILCQLRKPDSNLQGAALARALVKRIRVDKADIMHLISSAPEPVALGAINTAGLWHDDPDIFLLAARSEHASVRHVTWRVKPLAVQNALLPVAIEEIRKMNTDAQVKDGTEVFVFLATYDGLCNPEPPVPPTTVLQAKKWLACHEHIARAREEGLRLIRDVAAAGR